MSRSIARRLIVAPFVFSTVCVVIGCAESAHPLSNEKTSILDEQLIGVWEVVDDKQAEKERQKSRVQVEQSAKSKPALTVKWLDPENKSPSATILATELGDRRYLSYGGYEEDQRREAWLLLQYEVKDAGTVRVRQIKSDVVAQDVRQGRLKGKVTERNPTSKQAGKQTKNESPTVRLEASTEELRAYVESMPDKLFGDEWLTFKRVKTE